MSTPRKVKMELKSQRQRLLVLLALARDGIYPSEKQRNSMDEGSNRQFWFIDEQGNLTVDYSNVRYKKLFLDYEKMTPELFSEKSRSA